MNRRHWLAWCATVGVLSPARAQPRSPGERELHRQRWRREEQCRAYLRARGFAEFFGDARGDYIPVGSRRRAQAAENRLLKQASQAFSAPLDSRELASGLVMMGGFQARFALHRCYVLLRSWEGPVLVVGLLNAQRHFFAPGEQSPEVLQAEARPGVELVQLSAEAPRGEDWDAKILLSLFHRVEPPEEAVRSLIEMVRNDLQLWRDRSEFYVERQRLP